jgi:hypothetical protein
VSDSIEQRAKDVETALDATVNTIRNKAREYQRQAEAQRRRFAWAKGATVTLGVLTPTFVTFQTQHTGTPEVSLWLGIAAIAITASTGIVTGLQATFRWGEGFSRASTASLELDELAATIDLDTMTARATTDHALKHAELTKQRDRALRQLQLITRKHIEGELAMIKEAERPREHVESTASRQLSSGA